jgi:hypothetical protein
MDQYMYPNMGPLVLPGQNITGLQPLSKFYVKHVP